MRLLLQGASLVLWLAAAQVAAAAATLLLALLLRRAFAPSEARR